MPPQSFDFDWTKLNYTTPIEKIKAVAPAIPQRILDTQKKYEDSLRGFSTGGFAYGQRDGNNEIFVSHRPNDAQVEQLFRISSTTSSKGIERISYFDLGSGRTIASLVPLQTDDWRGVNRTGGAILQMDTDGKEFFQLWRMWEDADPSTALPTIDGELSNKPSIFRIERLTHNDTVRFTAPAVSETKDLLLFSSTEENPSEYHVYLVDLTNSKTGLQPTSTEPLDLKRTRITTSPPDRRAKWHVMSSSLDNKYISISESKGPSHVPAYFLDISDRAALPALPQRILLPGATELDNQTKHPSFRFSKDPAHPHTAYFLADAYGDFLSAVVYDLDTRSMLHITTPKPDLHAIRPINWDIRSQTITSKAVYLTANVDAWSKLFVMPITGAHANEVIEIRFDGPGGDGAGIAFVTNDKNGRPFELCLQLSSYKSQGALMYADVEPALKHVQQDDDGCPFITVPITPYDQAQPVSPAYRTPAPKVVHFKSFDGLEVPFIYYHPAPGKRVPVNIDIHGGPTAQATSLRKSRIHGYLINELECAVIYPNVRGSIGYGKRYMAADDVYLREDSVKDIGALIDYIKENMQDEIDSDNIAVSGGSYGGYMTFACLTHYSDKLRCGLATCGIADWVAFLSNTAAHRQDHRRVEYGDETDPDVRAFLAKISPVAGADKITVPLWIAHGDNDTRVPFEQAHFMHDSLVQRGVYSELIVGVTEGHVFRQKDVLEYVSGSKILFLERIFGQTSRAPNTA
ncbi:alpha/beta-hydrolase [Auriculariales sp. MPI-PUGE-AT-0066]|nr:alpha/beta-hydrolase [Auriculariales sp. MPI-PUGE-AT-0066]